MSADKKTRTSKYAVGLTGGIGSGKSTVANMFASLGITLVDADAVAHDITAPTGRAIEPIRREFGAQALDAKGALHRAKMRNLVFSDETAKRRLEAILHPMIRDESKRLFEQASSPYVLCVIPLLFESGNWKQRMQRTLLIDCPEEMQVERVMQRSGLTAAEVRAIMAKQMSRQERLKLADDIVDNSGDESRLHEPVHRLHEHYLTLAQQYRQSMA
jgi:dephospho-CoA kinase